MNITEIKEHLNNHGWCIVPNVLSNEEVKEAKQMFYNWQTTIKNHDYLHNTIDPHSIYKYHEAGHQEHAWFIRTRPKVKEVFSGLWNTDELVVSFDGSCYVSKECKKKDAIWTHSDQAPSIQKLACYQGFVSLTNNKERTLVVYDKTHLIHNEYFKRKNIMNNENWNLIDKQDVMNAHKLKRVLTVPAGALVLWDSRTFHQNQYGAPCSEERMVQYVCFLPKNNAKNSEQMRIKRKKYFEERRTTSHWPYPIRVNALQPRTFGNKNKNIDYSELTRVNLDKYMLDIANML
tara:strand:- start:35 stop:904 length:870 start_codon:yes stop_codon:yes gene_type:complete